MKLTTLDVFAKRIDILLQEVGHNPNMASDARIEILEMIMTTRTEFREAYETKLNKIKEALRQDTFSQ